jgi:elongation factor P
MISSNDFKNGMTIELENVLYTIVEFQHVKPGKGQAFVRTKIKNLINGNTLEKTFKAGEKVPRAHIDKKPMQYLYNTGDAYVFMDSESYDQVNVDPGTMGETVKWLKDSATMDILMHGEKIIGIEPPAHMELVITHTEPGFKGDTAQGGNKPATLETGATINVPLFVEIGDKVLVDTRSSEYLKRA